MTRRKEKILASIVTNLKGAQSAATPIRSILTPKRKIKRKILFVPLGGRIAVHAWNNG